VSPGIAEAPTAKATAAIAATSAGDFHVDRVEHESAYLSKHYAAEQKDPTKSMICGASVLAIGDGS
jgi:hypothetical protein